VVTAQSPQAPAEDDGNDAVFTFLTEQVQ